MCNTSRAATNWTSIPVRDNRGTVLIHVAWVDATKQYYGSGTGFVVGKDGSVLTVAHEIPVSPVAMSLTGETEATPDYPRQSFELKLDSIDRVADIAVLVPIEPEKVILPPVPVQWNWVPKELADIYVRGYPLGGALSGTTGIVTRTETSSRVPTNTLLRAGVSGAPVYGDSGVVVGMARGGDLVGSNVSKDDITVLGLGFFVPLSLLKDKIPPALVLASLTTPAELPPVALLPRIGEIRQAYAIDRTKETLVGCTVDGFFNGAPSKEDQVLTFKSQEGFRITSYHLDELSANFVSNRDIQILDDGATIQIKFSLTSGPPCDRTRGWLAATLNTVQVPRGNP